MNDVRKKFLSQSLGGADFSDSWEYECVKFATENRDSYVRRAVYDTARDVFGEETFSIKAFSEAFPYFPMLLVPYANSKKVDGVTFNKLFNSFEKQFFFDLYEGAVEQVVAQSVNKSVGVVIRWARINGGMLLHDHAYDFSTPGTRLFYVADNKRLTLEPFRQFIGTLSDDVFRS